MTIIVILLILIVIFASIALYQEYMQGSSGGNQQIPRCLKTEFGCCPDGMTIKLDPFGSNCVGERLRPINRH